MTRHSVTVYYTAGPYIYTGSRREVEFYYRMAKKLGLGVSEISRVGEKVPA
jgi:hypothetical protein